MAAKLKVDQLESVDGSTNITLNNSITMAATKTLPAASLTGTLPAISGASLTSLTAANLTGTIADARFPATLPAASAANLTAVPAANITGTLPAIDGSNLTGVSGGKVLQVVQTTTNTSVTVASSTYTAVGASASITPSSTSSKILVMHNAGGMGYNSDDVAMRIKRNSTEILVMARQAYNNSANWVANSFTANYLDSPSTTSSVTYSFEIKVKNSASTGQIEHNSYNSAFATNVNGAVTILMEIAG
jgi:hypothetical protein